MRKIPIRCRESLDGIAGPNGEADWIVIDPDVNFAEIWAQFDTFSGRRTYEAAIQIRQVVFSGDEDVRRLKNSETDQTIRK